ncbi:hypothetical protein [Microvirga sp. 2TAF3]|uniref:hypothetical protein n=1 Tax=Microvirga sp. 2TAF3 TaxID=3233014 RepID=UPI003F9D341B
MKLTTHEVAWSTINAIALSVAIYALLPLAIASSAEAQDIRTSCEPGRYPDDGNFEVAEITERTSAIMDLQKKQESQRQSYAEAGTIVVVWNRSGQHACVRSPTGIPDIDFWVDQRSLRNFSEAGSDGDPWVGNYGQPSVVEIKSAKNGKYEIYGEYEHTIEDGPRWSRTTSNEIFAHGATPQASAIQVTLKKETSQSQPERPRGARVPVLLMIAANLCCSLRGLFC